MDSGTSSLSAAEPQGDQAPRILLAPERDRSDGSAAVRLAAAAGLFLDPWQQLVLEVVLGRSKSGRWAAKESCLIVARQNGKGSVLEALELYALFVLREPLILHTAHEFKTAKDAYRRVVGLIQSTPTLANRVAAYPRNPSEFGVDLKTGERLRFIARSSGSGRGYTAHRVILDEAYKLGEEAMSALGPTMKAVPDAQIMYASSAAWATSDQLHAVRKRALAGESKRLAYLEWSAPEDCDPADPKAWAQANPGLGIRISHEAMRDDLDMLPLSAFRREDLSIPDGATGEAVLPMDAWRACQARGARSTARAVFAVDIAPDRSSGSIGVASRMPGGKILVEVVDHRPGTAWLIPKLIDLSKRWRPGALLLDPGAPAGSLVRDLTDAKIEPRLINSREYGQSCGAFYDAVMTASVRHLGDPLLDASVGAATKRKLGDAWAWDRLGGADITPLVACTLAFWGVANRKTSRFVNLSAALEAADQQES